MICLLDKSGMEGVASFHQSSPSSRRCLQIGYTNKLGKANPLDSYCKPAGYRQSAGDSSHLTKCTEIE